MQADSIAENAANTRLAALGGGCLIVQSYLIPLANDGSLNQYTESKGGVKTGKSSPFIE